MKKAATRFEEMMDFVRDVQSKRIHLLGMGYERRHARRVVRILFSLSSELQISMDSNRIRAVTGRERRMTMLESGLRAEEPGSLNGEVECEALDLAGVRLDYTDLIASPSQWATQEQLLAVAKIIGLLPKATEALLVDPDNFLQQPLKGNEGLLICICLTWNTHSTRLGRQTSKPKNRRLYARPQY